MKSAGIASAVLFIALVGSRPVAANAILKLDPDSYRTDIARSVVQRGLADDVTMAQSFTARHAALALEGLPKNIVFRSLDRPDTNVFQRVLATPVPEPVTLVTLGLGLIVLSMWQSRWFATHPPTPRV